MAGLGMVREMDEVMGGSWKRGQRGRNVVRLEARVCRCVTGSGA